MGSISVVLADNHDVVRSGLRAVLASDTDISVVAEAADTLDAVRAVLRHQPDLVVTGLDTAAVREVLRALPRVRVLVFTLADDDDSVYQAIRAGARGYLLKSAQQAEIVRAVRGVAAGEAIFGEGVAHRVAELLTAPARRAEDVFPELTRRERQVLDLIADGRSNSVIARQLHLAPKTVSNHISAIFTKLRAADRAEAIARARDAGIGAHTPRRVPLSVTPNVGSVHIRASGLISA
ncbi:LuxR C-terminal-related transcriptional regulator [Kutzneria kofuensis]|uniref:DNA-binding NarL/FixJ family response regulator n=1 Tax=Kutzneria kofuensis TaxID=103725 RepID=A0A7W9NKA8_9PSEU|nr:response regulator transcription factor [Kutzneria kofuensis]MBB5895191.1 DNA-binding NarL/FixJ family response regulator [Kutzneria kofuensis]